MSKFTWTPETVERCSELYAQGQHSAAQIGDIIGTSKGSVIGKMDRLGVRSPRTRADNTPPQPREAKPRIIPSRYKKSSKETSDEIRALTGRKNGNIPVFDPDDIMRHAMRISHPLDAQAQRKRFAVPAPVAPPAPVLRLVSHGKTLLHLSERECRYAVGTNDAGEHTFCAAPTPSGSSWCPACRAIVYAPANYKTRIGHTAGRRFA